MRRFLVPFCAIVAASCASAPPPDPQIAPMGNAWEAHLGVDDRDAHVFDELPPQGMRAIDVTGWSIDGDVRYTSLWMFADIHGWETRRGVDAPTLSKEDAAHAEAGMHLVRLDGFDVDGAARFAAIWELGDPRDRSWKIDLDEDAFTQENQASTDRGWQLVDLSTYADADDRPRWTAIWAPRPEGSTIETTPYLALDAPTLERTLAEVSTKNERPIAIDAAIVDGAPRFTLLTSNALGPLWVARCELDADGWQRQLEDLLTVGYRPIRLSGYVVEKSPRFCAIWSK